MRRSQLLTAAFAALLALTAQPARADPPPDRVGSIIVEGNTATPDTVILQLVRLYPGQVLKYPELEKARARLVATGLFRADRPPTVEALPNELDSEFKDVRICVEEGPYNAAIWTTVQMVSFFLDGTMWRLARQTIVYLALSVGDSDGIGGWIVGLIEEIVFD